MLSVEAIKARLYREAAIGNDASHVLYFIERMEYAQLYEEDELLEQIKPLYKDHLSFINGLNLPGD